MATVLLKLMEAAYNAERAYLQPITRKRIPEWDELDGFECARLEKMVRAVIQVMDK